MSSIASVYVDIIPSMKGAQGKITESLGGAKAGSSAGQSIGKNILGAVKKYAAPLAALTGGLAIGKFAKDSMKEFDGLASSVKGMQRVTGGTVQEVSGLRGAMQLSGVAVDKAQTSLGIFAKKLGAANDGGAKAAKMTTALGTSFTDAKGDILPMSQLLPKVSDTFANMPDGPAKSALAMQLFGKQGNAMLPFLNKGSAGIAELTAKAGQMGLVLDDTSMSIMAASKVSAREFGASIQGLKVAVGQNLTPIVTSVKNVGRQIMTPIIQGITGGLNAGRDGIMSFAGKIQAFADRAGQAVQGVLQVLRTGQAAPDFGITASSPVFGVLTKIRTVAASTFSSVKEGAKGFWTALTTGQSSAASSGFGQFLTSIGQIAHDVFAALGPTIKQVGPQIMAVAQAFSPLHLAVSALQPVMPQIAAALSAVAQALGGALASVLPVVSQLLAQIAQALSGTLAAILPTIAQLVTSLAQTFQQLAPVILQIVQSVGGALSGALGQVLPILAQVAAQVASQLAPVLQQVLPIIAQLAGMLAGALGEALAQILPIIAQLISALAPLVGPILEALMPILRLIVGLIQVLLPPIMQLIPPIMQIVQALTPIIALIAQLVAQLLPPIIQLIMAVVEPILQLVQPLMGLLTPVLQLIGQLLQSIVVPILTVLVQVLAKVFSAVMPVVQALIGGLVKALTAVIKAVVNVVAGIARFVTQGIQGFQRFVQGVSQNIQKAIAFIKGLPGQAGRAIAALATEMVSRGKKGIDGLLQGIKNGWNAVMGWLGGIPGRIKSGIGDLGGLLVGIGSDLIAGLRRGIESAWATVQGWIAGLAAKLPAPIRKALGIHSPSRVFRDKVGVQIPRGIAAGIAKGSDQLFTQLRSLGDRIAAAGKAAIKQADSAYKKAAKAGKKAAAAAAKRDKKTAAASAKRAQALLAAQNRVTARGQSNPYAGTLLDMAKARDAVNNRLRSANDTLKGLLDDYASMRDQIAGSIKGELDLTQGIVVNNSGVVLSDFTNFESVASQVSNLAARAEKFAGKLNQLKKIGIPAGLVNEVAGYGTEKGSAVADALLKGNGVQIAKLKQDYSALTTWSNAAGNAVASATYDTAIAAQQGLIRGLTAQSKALDNAAKALANRLTKAVKKALKIKSPSRVFRDDIAGNVVGGLALGLDDGRKTVANAAAKLLDPAQLSTSVSASVTGSLQPATPKVLVFVKDPVTGKYLEARMKEIAEDEVEAVVDEATRALVNGGAR